MLCDGMIITNSVSPTAPWSLTAYATTQRDFSQNVD